jgi:hypothetical protein
LLTCDRHIKAQYKTGCSAREAVDVFKKARDNHASRIYASYADDQATETIDNGFEGKEEEEEVDENELGTAVGEQEMTAPVLIGDDFELGKPLGDQKLKDEIQAELDNLVGMEEAKKWFRKLKKKVEYVHRTGDMQILQQCLNLVITGNPGIWWLVTLDLYLKRRPASYSCPLPHLIRTLFSIL